jgi:hypothetical protein
MTEGIGIGRLSCKCLVVASVAKVGGIKYTWSAKTGAWRIIPPLLS